ncbi:MAG: 3'-5' exonuclease [Lentimicrobiaceae bacterium]|jgi:DNA polymerase-3 subunit epsilon|nr:3'-5' exonuclease [Lentimicrobiaceae bacterium]
MELKLTKPIVFLDLETTGINVTTDRIVEISIIKVNINNSTETRTQLINPTIPIPKVVTAIHGISNEDVKDCPTFAEVAHSFAQFIGNADLAGYNSIKFDIPLLMEEFLRVNVDFDMKGRRIVDVQNIFHKMEQRTLSAAYKFYCGKTIENAHRAEADAMATYEILKSQLDMYEGKSFIDSRTKKEQLIINDVKALHDFSYYSKSADLIGHIIYDNDIEIFNFGKHKGKPVSEVFKTEPAYYDWMMKAEFPLYTKKVITAIKLRGFNNNSVNVD